MMKFAFKWRKLDYRYITMLPWRMTQDANDLKISNGQNLKERELLKLYLS
jgi:hypothetical protein